MEIFFKSKNMVFCIAALALCSSLISLSCVSLMEGTGRVLDGSAFTEKKIALYRSEKIGITLVQNKAAERSVIIALSDFPMMKIRGTAPDENNEFFLTALEYLGGNVHGWNEYTLELSGDGELFLGETAVISINDEIEPVQITSGRIHRYDTRITGVEALSNLRNRRERIIAVVQWISSTEGVGNGQKIDDFEKYWKPRLFPEMVSKKNKPDGWLEEGDVFIKAEDIRWNTTYTERLFPEELWPVRNSGTLLRDWEEALYWIYLEYEWGNIKDTLSRRTTLNPAKK